MRRWLQKLTWTRFDAWDAVFTSFLGIVLCAAPVTFMRTTLQGDSWQPVVHRLSEDGTIYLSLNLEGIRLHDAATGEEIDRTVFGGPLPQNVSEYGETARVLHPIELRAPEGGEWNQRAFRSGHELGRVLDYGRSRIKISPSKRYVLASFPAGYFLLWDRTKGAVRLHAEPEYLFEAVTIDESQDRLLIEAVPRGGEPLIVTEKTPAVGDDEALNEQVSLRVLIYRLSDLNRLEVVDTEAAGKRIGDDPNLRLVYDEDAEEYRVKRCDEFPFGSERVILRFKPRQLWSGDNPEFEVRRIDGDHAILVDFRKAPVEMISSADPTGAKTKWELPKEASDRTWLECGAVSLGGESGSGQPVTTWDVENSFAVFNLPSYDTFSEAAMIRTAQGEKRVRLAGLEGNVIDLPLGERGEISARWMRFRATSDWPLASAGWTLAAGVLWSISALARRRFRSQGGWLVLGQWLLTCGAIVVIDGFLAGAPFAMLGYAPLLILQTGVIALAVVGALRGYSLRRQVVLLVVCLVAVTTIVTLGAAASLQLPTQPPSWGGGCCMFMCFGAPGGGP
jgi:hypothetical protein